MYRNQTRNEMVRDALLVTFMPALIMGGVLIAIFHGVGDAYNVDGLPWGFIGLFSGLCLLGGVFSAVQAWLAGPCTVPMKPAEEAAKRAQIHADMEARMRQAEYEAEDIRLWGSKDSMESYATR